VASEIAARGAMAPNVRLLLDIKPHVLGIMLR
jgi:hypothetical protein